MSSRATDERAAQPGPEIPTEHPHIVRKPGTCGGAPLIRGTRITVRHLALLYQEETAGGDKSNFNKLIGRETAEAREAGERHASRHHPHGRRS